MAGLMSWRNWNAGVLSFTRSWAGSGTSARINGGSRSRAPSSPSCDISQPGACTATGHDGSRAVQCRWELPCAATTPTGAQFRGSYSPHRIEADEDRAAGARRCADLPLPAADRPV